MQHTFLKKAARVALVLSLITQVAPALAWTGPSTAPPNGNAATPLDTSASTQTKSGALILGAGSNGNWSLLNVGTASNGTSIDALGSVYSYGSICTGNSLGTCTGTGGVVLNSNGSVVTAGTITANPPSGANGVVGNTISANGVYGNASSNGIGVQGNSVSGYGLYGHSVSSWGAVIVQDPGSLGLVVENSTGSIYTELMQGGYGLLTNQNISTTGYYYGKNAFGGGFEMSSGGGCYVANAWTTGCSCPSFAPSAAYTYYMDTNSTYGGGRGYTCY